jgi:flavodoxin
MGNTKKEEAMPPPGTKRILVAYFSHSGNTREIANQIHAVVGGDIFQIEVVEPYPDNYDAVVERAGQELHSGYRPALKARIESIKPFDLVFIGYPNWWGTIPAPVRVFLTEDDFPGEIVIPFCTHEGSGLGRSVADIAKLCPKSTVRDGAAFRGRDVKTAQRAVSEWLRGMECGG